MFQLNSKELTGQKSKGNRDPQRGKTNTGVDFALSHLLIQAKLNFDWSSDHEGAKVKSEEYNMRISPH